MSDRELTGKMGVAGASFTIIGFVIGISIFFLPGELAAGDNPSEGTGPWVVLCLLFAAVPAFFSCFVASQAGNIFPISGSMYTAVSTILSPFWGFVIVWNVLIAMIVGIPLTAYAFAEYLEYFLPGLPAMPVAIAVVLVFGLINLTGVKATVWFQGTMIMICIVVMALFGIGGLFFIDTGNYVPAFPNGLGPVITGGVVFAYTFNGFMVITEMGDEIRNPRRTIPIALLISFTTVLVLYGSVSLVLPGLIHWDDLRSVPAPVATASERFLPAGFAHIIAASALLGAATSVNAWFLTQTRDIYALARDRVLPAKLAKISRIGEPTNAIIFAVLATVGGVLLGRRVEEYAILTVQASFLIFIICSIAIVMAPKKVPALYARAKFKLGPIGLPFFCIGFALICIAFEIIGALESPVTVLIYFALLGPGVIYYFLRKAFLRRKGIYIEDMLRKDLSHILERDD